MSELRKIRETDLVGKTIKSIEHDAANVLKLTFTNGSTLELWAEDVVRTNFGSIPGILVQD